VVSQRGIRRECCSVGADCCEGGRSFFSPREGDEWGAAWTRVTQPRHGYPSVDPCLAAADGSMVCATRKKALPDERVAVALETRLVCTPQWPRNNNRERHSMAMQCL
jgi:hypothetical protein